MIRFYILPIEDDGAGARGPKYLEWRFDPDPPALVPGIRWSLKDYGLVDAALVAAELTQAQHEALAAESDVAAPPENIDQNISDLAIPQVQVVLEQLRIPADWVDNTYTYRQILRMIAGLFQFAQRHHGMHNEGLIDNTAQLDLRWNQIPPDRRNRILATADAMDPPYDYSEVTNTWLIRRILKHLADQWGTQPIHFGFVTL